jgi:transmembrane sensor
MDRKLLEKYFSGEECSPEELAAIREYLDSGAPTFFEETWQQAGGLVNEKRKAINWKAIQKGTTGRFQWRPYAAAALISGLLILCGVFLFRSAPQAEWKEVHNTSGNVRLITMPDGTRIWLNNHTSIRYADNYGKHDRTLHLSGEAYFDVTKDAAAPFSIHTDDLQTTVLGTTFTIRAWPAINNIEVALVTGSVQVTGPGQAPEKLQPGDVLRFSKTDRHIQRLPAAVRPDMHAWISGKIVLSNTPLTEALQQLEQIYQVKIHCAPNNKKLTGQFNRESIDTVLTNLLFAADMTFKKENGIYYITKK